MVIERFRLQKIYFKFLIDAIAKDFLGEMSLSVSNRLPNSLHSFRDSFLFCLISYSSVCFVYMKVSGFYFLANSLFVMVNFVFITCNERDIISIFLARFTAIVFLLE